jgi:hypothetical protein
MSAPRPCVSINGSRQQAGDGRMDHDGPLRMPLSSVISRLQRRAVSSHDTPTKVLPITRFVHDEPDFRLAVDPVQGPFLMLFFRAAPCFPPVGPG